MTDKVNVVLAESDESLVGSSYTNSEDKNPTVLLFQPGQPFTIFYSQQVAQSIGPAVQNYTVGILHVLRGDAADINRAALNYTYESIGKYFIWGGLLSIAIALQLTFFLFPTSWRRSGPCPRYQHFGKGDFSQGGERTKGNSASFRARSTPWRTTWKHTKAAAATCGGCRPRAKDTALLPQSYLEAIRTGHQAGQETIRSLVRKRPRLCEWGRTQELSLADAARSMLESRRKNKAIIRDT
jgi:hypothetical protein